MPLADATSVVAGSFQDFRKSNRIRAERNIVQENPVCLRTLTGQQRCSRGRTHRHSSNGLGEVDALALERIEMRRLYIRVPRVPERLRAPLIGDDEEDVGGRLAGCCGGTGLVRSRERCAPETECGYERPYAIHGLCV